MVLHKNVGVRNSDIEGTGIYATGEIKKGEIIWQTEPNERELYWYHVDTINKWEKEKREDFLKRAYLVGDGWYSGVPCGENIYTDNSEFMNHSCDPNCVFAADDNVMIASRDIVIGEEICYDYATSEVEGSSQLPLDCKCGSKKCRGMVKCTDYRENWFWESYAKDKKITKLVAEKLKEIKNSKN